MRGLIGEELLPRKPPGTATDEGAEMEDTLLITNEATVTGRLSWEQLFPD